MSECDDLDVDVRVVETERLDAQLPGAAGNDRVGARCASEQWREVPDLPRPVLLVLDVGVVTGAVPSGRSAKRRFPRSVNLYISFVRTMSVPSPSRLTTSTVLEHGSDNEVETESACSLGKGVHDLDPLCGRRRQDVLRSARNLLRGPSACGIVPAVSRPAAVLRPCPPSGSTRYAVAKGVDPLHGTQDRLEGALGLAHDEVEPQLGHPVARCLGRGRRGC